MKLDLIKKEIEKNNDRIYEDDFFEMIKDSSLITFRNNINYIQSIKPSLFLENKVTNYYESLLDEFNSETSLFRIYDSFIEMIKLGIEDFFDNYDDYNYIITSDVIEEIKKKLHNKNKLNDCYDFLIKTTNEKISEIIIDALFKDSIYNVWLNIKEMLRFNDSLLENEKVLNDEKISFYQTILDFDKINSNEKIDFYMKLKDKQINLMFYNDLRKLKDLSYKKIKKSMINLKQHPEFKSKELSSNFNIDVYDLRDKDYIMLVTCSDKFVDNTNDIFGCYTLLSNENTAVYDQDKFIYGYYSFPEEYVMHVFEEDAGSSPIKVDDSLNIGSRKVNRLMQPKEIIINGNQHSEINLKNIISNEDIGKNSNKIFNLMTPDFIVAIDNIEEKHVLESKRLNIPIVIIKNKSLDKDTGTISYNYNLDDYTIWNFQALEDIRKSKR